MFKIFETAINYLFISHHNDPIRQYCQTEFKENWKAKYYELTGKTIESIVTLIAVSDGTSQLFVEQPSDDYVDQLLELRSQYRSEYGL